MPHIKSYKRTEKNRTSLSTISNEDPELRLNKATREELIDYVDCMRRFVAVIGETNIPSEIERKEQLEKKIEELERELYKPY